MKRVLLAFGIALAVLGGCRALVGIDDLDYQPPQPDGGRNNNGSSSSGNGGGFDPIACVDAGADGCRKCCKEKFGAFRTAFERGPGAACVCDAGGCGLLCAASVCASTPGTSAPTPDCAKCADDFLGRPPGSAQETTCGFACSGNPECENGVRCMENCLANNQ